ncbi:MAG: HU family DNA-binding protein [Pseudanabaena sp. ELA748]
MNKGQLIDAIAERVSAVVTKKQIEAVLTANFEVIQEAVAADDKVTIVGFGSWELRDRAEREGRNPKTGETMTIPATKAVGFSAGKQFKDLVNGK